MVELAQTLGPPVIADGCAGAVITVKLVGLEVVPFELVTATAPEPELPTTAII